MLTVTAYGELLIDFIASPPVSGEAPQWRQFAGGAPANAVVAVARLGGDARFIGRVGADAFGDFLIGALAHEGVDASAVSRSATASTPLAFVALDAHGERSFTFYRRATADLEFSPADFAQLGFPGRGILHVCSNTLTDAGIAAATLAGAQQAHAAGWLVSFDVNLRPALWPAGRDPLAPVTEIAAASDLIKLSREELDALRGATPAADYVDGLLEQGAQLVLVTDGGQPMHYATRTQRGVRVPPAVRAVDTTAAGDAFCGGLLYALARLDIGREQLPGFLADTPRLDAVLDFALACGAFAATRPGAFASLPRLAELAVAVPD